MSGRTVVWSILLAVLLAASTGGAFPTAASASSAPPCTDSSSRRLVESFITNFNAGNIGELDRVFTTNPFHWYSTDAPGARVGDAADDRTTLMAYFASRHAVHERLKLESFQFNGASGVMATGDLAFELTRSADDLSATPYGGKGAIACWTSPPTITTWSMAREPFLRARLPLYASATGLILGALVAMGIVVGRRRRRGQGAARRLA